MCTIRIPVPNFGFLLMKLYALLYCPGLCNQNITVHVKQVYILAIVFTNLMYIIRFVNKGTCKFCDS